MKEEEGLSKSPRETKHEKVALLFWGYALPHLASGM